MKAVYTKSDYVERVRIFRCPNCKEAMPEPEHGIHTACPSCEQKMIAHGNRLTLFYECWRGNVINVCGLKPLGTIGEMRKGDSGYAVPAAYDEKTNVLNERHRVMDTMGQVYTMFVKCIVPGEYEIEF